MDVKDTGGGPWIGEREAACLKARGGERRRTDAGGSRRGPERRSPSSGHQRSG